MNCTGAACELPLFISRHSPSELVQVSDGRRCRQQRYGNYYHARLFEVHVQGSSKLCIIQSSIGVNASYVVTVPLVLPNSVG